MDSALPKAIEAPVDEDGKATILAIDNNFNKDDRIILKNHKLLKPNDLTQVNPQKLLEEKKKAGEIAIRLGSKKRHSKIPEEKHSFDRELQTLKKYRETIADVLASFKYQTGQGMKIGAGVVCYNNIEDLLSRLQLLGGSIFAGNNSVGVRDEFVNILHVLKRLGIVGNEELNKIMMKYLL